MRERTRLSLSDDTREVLVKMAEGNPGAISVLVQLVQLPGGLIDVLNLDEMNIRGPQIWVGYKDFCKQEILEFQAAVRRRDADMIAVINHECPEYPQAVVGRVNQ